MNRTIDVYSNDELFMIAIRKVAFEEGNPFLAYHEKVDLIQLHPNNRVHFQLTVGGVVDADKPKAIDKMLRAYGYKLRDWQIMLTDSDQEAGRIKMRLYIEQLKRRKP